ncbi:MAG TPA: iron-containing alcohol dehydrogenase, partial [Polyangiaceae bacterium]
VAFQKGLGACHSLAHPLSTQHGLHHGLANALCLPAVAAFNEEAALQRVLHVAVLLGAAPTRGGCANALCALRVRVGLPAGLGAVGITADHVDALSREAIDDACHRLNPRACSREDLAELYRASL